MGKVKQKKDKHFIPSPYKVVTEYENEFVKQWNKNTKNAILDVVKYIADLVTDDKNEIKNE